MPFKYTTDKPPKAPEAYPRVERKLPTASDKGWTRIGGFTLRDKVDFAPQPGLQEDVCQCESNIVYMCGAATMGKSFCEILSVLYGVDKRGRSSAMISTRLQDSKKGSSIFRDNELVLGAFAGCEYNTSDYPTFYWPAWKSTHRLIHSNFNTDNPAERAQFIEYAKKNQNSLQIFDEANDLSEFQYRYWNSRNRDASGMTPQSVYSFNPPGPDSYFTRNLRNAGYIGDDWYFKPEMNGATRYFYALGDDVDSYVWGDTPQAVCDAAGIEITERDRAAGLTEASMVKSFTAFTGEAADNRILVAATGGQSVANLHAVGKTQRDVLKGAYFGPIDSDEINVTRAMLHDLWQNPDDDDEAMYATLDVSRSISRKSDDSPLVIWRGLRIVAIEMLRADLRSLVGIIHSTLARYKVPISNFAFDSGGIGEYLQDFTEGNPIKGNRRPVQEYDQYGNPVEMERYFDLRSQLHGKAEALIRTGAMSCAVDKNKILPYGHDGRTRALIDILSDEINVFITTVRNGKTYYRSKEEYKSKFRSSPDIMDAIVMRSFFALDARPKKQAPHRAPDNVYHSLYHRPPVRGAMPRQELNKYYHNGR